MKKLKLIFVGLLLIITINIILLNYQNSDNNNNVINNELSSIQNNSKLVLNDETNLGKTVTINYDLKDSNILPESIILGTSNFGDATQLIQLFRCNVDDSSNTLFISNDIYDDDYCDIYIEFEIKSNGLSGVLSYDFSGKCLTTLTYIDSTKTIDSSYSNSEGNLKFYASGLFVKSTKTYIVGLFIFNFETLLFESLGMTSKVEASSTISSIQFILQYLAFIPNDIESIIISEYKYISNSKIQHSLKIESFDYNTEITIFKPITWKYSEITPIADVEFSVNDIILKHTIPIVYIISFIEERKNYLPLIDISSDYLTDISFENTSLINDFYCQNSYLNATLNNEIVSHKAQSIKVYQQYSLNYFRLKPDILPLNTEMYVSFDYYLDDSLSGNPFYFAIYSSGWIYNNLANDISAETYKWHTAIYKINLTSNSVSNFCFSSGKSGITWYIDNIRFYSASSQLETIANNTYQLTTTFISLDNVENRRMNNIEVYTELYSYLDDSLIHTFINYTDYLGRIFIYFSDFVINENYRITTYSIDSRFKEYYFETFGYANDFENNNEHITYFYKLANTYSVDIYDSIATFSMQKKNGEDSVYLIYYLDNFPSISTIYDYTMIAKVKVDNITASSHFHYRDNVLGDISTAFNNQSLVNSLEYKILKTNGSDWIINPIDSLTFVLRFYDLPLADTNTFSFSIDYILLFHNSFATNTTITPLAFFESATLKDVTISFFNKNNGLGLLPQTLKIFYKDLRIDDFSRTSNNFEIYSYSTFGLQIKDYYDNILYSNESLSYARYLDVELDILRVILTYNQTLYNDILHFNITNNNVTSKYMFNSDVQYISLDVINSIYNITVYPELHYSENFDYRFESLSSIYNVSTNEQLIELQIATFPLFDLKERTNPLILIGDFITYFSLGITVIYASFKFSFHIKSQKIVIRIIVALTILAIGGLVYAFSDNLYYLVIIGFLPLVTYLITLIFIKNKGDITI